ncbi:MAG: cysteine-rich CWC family protein [Flavipsychrobacter sp.]
MASKKCSKCGAAFGCHPNSNGCWCEQYQLSTASLQELKANFSDCLCPQCLAEYETTENEDERKSNNTAN